jgi:hypothetical protein
MIVEIFECLLDCVQIRSRPGTYTPRIGQRTGAEEDAGARAPLCQYAKGVVRYLSIAHEVAELLSAFMESVELAGV